ncbi:hypothetical protein [Serratia aquatilis]|uniref:Uncharacterized protein n=1 Tax=Serratia aquatilis TaxID=1737515 RepID=A0ABV6EBX9_9GAMM
MANTNPHVVEFIALFNQTVRYHFYYKAFRDFVQMAVNLPVKVNSARFDPLNVRDVLFYLMEYFG